MHKYEHLKDIPLFSTIIVLAFGFFGAIFNYSKHKKSEMPFRRRITIFFIDLITSSGYSVLTFYACMAYGLAEPLSVAIAGAVAYNGTRFMYILELVVAKKFGGDAIVEAIKEKDKGNKNDK